MTSKELFERNVQLRKDIISAIREKVFFDSVELRSHNHYPQVEYYNKSGNAASAKALKVLCRDAGGMVYNSYGQYIELDDLFTDSLVFLLEQIENVQQG